MSCAQADAGSSSTSGSGSDILQICETFLSIQGESTWAGLPCFFIRLTGCNLRCSYCDTRYAYEGGDARPVGELVREFERSGVGLVEVTGGEPLLQAGTVGLLEALRHRGTVLLETNGSIDISKVPDGVVTIMDIKCPSSGAVESMIWSNIDLLRRQDEVKFVIGDRGDFDWAARMTREHQIAGKCHAVLMSPSFGRVAPSDLADWIIAGGVPARLNLQIHRVIWNES